MSLAACPVQSTRTTERVLMKMNRFGKLLLCMAVLLLALAGATAAAEATITFSPENPKAGEYIDVTVEPEREGAIAVRYTLSTKSGTVFKGEDCTHFTASFRPREQASYTLTATIVYGKKDTESVSVTIPVSGSVPVQEGEDVLYSQKDGWWHNKTYSKKHHRSLEKAGCAIFTLSHVLQRMGVTGEDVLPDKLAERYSGMYIEGRGTDNERLLFTAGDQFGFQTHQDLIESDKELTTWFKQGCRFSFMIVIGHIALADGLSEDGTKVHVVDSAPGATWERIKKASLYIQKEDGTFTAVTSPEEIPGCRWFFESGEYGGLEYWLDLSYCAKQGMRPVRQAWLQLNGQPVTSFEYAGSLMSKVAVSGGESQRVNTRDLTWTTSGSDTPQLALVTGKKGAALLDGNGKKKAGISKAIPYGTMVFVLETTDKQFYIPWRDSFGYISRDAAELISISEDSFRTGLVSLNGRTAGTAPITVRKEPSTKAKSIGEWKPGTPVAILGQDGEFYLVEGKGLRGWIHNKYLTLEGADNDGQKIDKGE